MYRLQLKRSPFAKLGIYSFDLFRPWGRNFSRDCPTTLERCTFLACDFPLRPTLAHAHCIAEALSLPNRAALSRKRVKNSIRIEKPSNNGPPNLDKFRKYAYDRFIASHARNTSRKYDWFHEFAELDCRYSGTPLELMASSPNLPLAVPITEPLLKSQKRDKHTRSQFTERLCNCHVILQ